MADRSNPIHIPEDSELAGLLRESALSGRPINMEIGGEIYTFTFVEEVPSINRPPDPERVKRSIAGTLAAAGSWKGLVDAEELKTYLRESRRAANRPAPEL
jgi:hypothetical protein